jgi:hypothetical protein
MSLARKWSERSQLQIVLSNVSGSPSTFTEYSAQECDAVKSGGNWPAFRRNILSRISGSKHRL